MNLISTDRVLHSYSPNGWTKEKDGYHTFTDYIKHSFIVHMDKIKPLTQEQMQDGDDFNQDDWNEYRGALLMDTYPAHWCQPVIDLLLTQRILPILVVRGKTGDLQPLDISVNAQIEKIATKLWVDQRFSNFNSGILATSSKDDIRKSTILRAIKAYNMIKKQDVLRGWNIFV
jgi:hypothetical protein